MAPFRVNWAVFMVFVIMTNVGIGERLLKDELNHQVSKAKEKTQGLVAKVVMFLWHGGKSAYEPIWPEMEFGWKIVVGTVVGFLGAALGSVGGVGGGGI